MDEYLNQQQALLDNLLAAKEKYKGDIGNLIKAYEEALLNADPPLRNATKHAMDLCKLYLKTGQVQKAWSYLNRISVDYGVSIEKIRLMQAKILRQERKDIDAIALYIQGYTQKVNPSKEKFMSDVKPCITHLNWDAECSEYFFNIVKTFLGDEVSARKAYNNYLKEIGYGKS